MDSERTSKLQRVVAQAKTRPEPQREKFLNEALAADPELLQQAREELADATQRGRQRVAALGERLRRIVRKSAKSERREPAERPAAPSPPSAAAGAASPASLPRPLRQ